MDQVQFMTVLVTDDDDNAKAEWFVSGLDIWSTLNQSPPDPTIFIVNVLECMLIVMFEHKLVCNTFV